ncbi:class I SAM-dependent methyltransferase [Conexibacter sp. CPCC 206217]|uniref:class I SAM-dependent methyltransferase n=1 Tax=Conexibacter sp. CPCC 206217 TaxID=3064574 RepID=UPI0027272B6B|nr:methyltransferase domain-containing protein [Conexibacter sp. CPCC 206217]MDO8211279.1 methyltransferase domain-containing protein [Conexibacter sp. CPCC 206217]
MSGPSGVWALGDFPKVARETIAGTGAILVEACGVHSGQRLLDVAAGAGNVALPAARAGAEVVASDITPELLAAGRALAAGEGLGVEWVEADAQALPFGADAFDVVTSAFGAIFAPDHRATAAELLRVCRPGGTIGLLNWTPEGWSGQFFARLAAFMPAPPPDFQSPALWGHEPHLRELLGDGIADLRVQRRMVVLDHFATPADLVLFYRENFGPVIAVCRALADDPQALTALDEALIDFARRTNLAAGRGEGARYELEYLLVVARTRQAA